MKTLGIGVLSALASAAIASASLIGADHGGNYGGSWGNGSNGGTNFGAWAISGGGGGSYGSFIGDPSAGGISGMAADSFGLYANPNGPGNYVNADRSFGGGAMAAGNVFSFTWGVNWDSGGTGNKGFNLYSGGTGGSQLFNVNIGGADDITYDIGGGAQNLFTNYGVNAMTFMFTYDGSQLRVQANGRDGVETFDQSFTLSAPDSFRLYASDMTDSSANRQPYFDDFSMSAIPEPATIALLGLGLAGLLISRRSKK